MAIIPHLSQTMQTLLSTTDAVAAALQYVKRPDRAKFTPTWCRPWSMAAHPTATVEQLAGDPRGDGRAGGRRCLAPSH